jgi:putative transposase
MKKYNPNIHHRRSIRLKGYDYSQAGLYFITICCDDRICRFGQIENHEMILNDAGRMIEKEWLNLKNRFLNIQLCEFVVMPNHFHGILQITQSINIKNEPVGATLVVAQNQGRMVAQNQYNVDTKNQNHIFAQNDNQNKKGQPQGIAPTKTIGDMMDAFKSITTLEYIWGVKNLGWKPFNGKLWQRNYYEHIIRNEESYQTISNYVQNNPINWQADKLYEK